jgi:hypothetical protein
VLNVVQSTVAGNRAAAVGLCLRAAFPEPLPGDCVALHVAGGGGISSDGTLNIAFSTIAGNQAVPSPLVGCSPAGPGQETCPVGFGGGVLAGENLTVVDSTVTGNTTAEIINPSGNDALDSGPGVFVEGTGTATLAMSTLVDNTPDLTKQVVGAAVRGSILVGRTCSATAVDANHNLVSSAPCPGSPGDAGGIGNLGTNGGPTQTHLPSAASPAVNAIPAGTAGLCDGGLTADQRGQPRPSGAACDIGAVERQASDP